MVNKIIYWNCAGGIKSKIDFVRNLISKHSPTLCFISEADIESFDLDVVRVKDYDTVVPDSIKDRKARTLCYIKNDITYKKLSCHSDLDLISIDIGNERIVGLYKGFKLPPGVKPKSFFETIITALKALSATDKFITVGGDFNIDLNKKTANLAELEKWSIESGLNQLVNSFTRERVVTLMDGSTRFERSAIDHLYTNNDHYSLTTESSISDHHVLIVSHATPRQGQKKKFLVRDWREYNKLDVEILLIDKLQQISTPSSSLNLETLQEIYKNILDEVAPLRVIRTKEHQIINTKIEALKKRRDRYLKKFKKSGNPEHMDLAKSFTTTIKKAIKKESRRVFQCKAKSPNPKHFWEAVNEARGKFHEKIHEIEINGILSNDETIITNSFANFFREKVLSLSNGPIPMIKLPKPTSPVKFTIDDISKATKRLSNKKSYGTDKIPQNLFKDCLNIMKPEITGLLNEFSKEGLPQSLKIARVIPLHKKDEKYKLSNYRPISNLSPFSKLYECCLLSKLEEELPNADGLNQHGFRKHHSTESALLLIQSKMSKIIEAKKPGIIYSVDLSAAFDLLRPDKFYEIFKNRLSKGLMFALLDFLNERKFQVEMGEARSSTLSLDRGCVQGSILGPKLFSLYVSGLADKLASENVQIISYADDTYVIVSCDTALETVNMSEKVIIKHIYYLKSLGMTVNESKTEVMWIGGDKNKDLNCAPVDSLKIGSEDCKFVDNFKALGIFIQDNLSWDKQAEHAVSKGKKLVSNFKVLRRYLNEEQFLKAASANYYGTIFYGACIWFDQAKAKFKDKLQALHFRLLNTAVRDHGMKLTHQQLTERCRRATPKEWTNFVTASKVMKIVRDTQPIELHQLIMKNYFEEYRYPGVGLFFDSSKSKQGAQSLENRLIFMRSIKKPWNLKSPLTNDEIRIELKLQFFDYFTEKFAPIDKEKI